MSALTAWYDRRSGRERAAIGWIAIAAAALLLVAAWLQAERSRERLRTALPPLRASITSLEAAAAEVRRLRALPEVKARPNEPLASLGTQGGGVPGAQFTVLDDKRVRLSGPDVPFGALLAWLDHGRGFGMRVESARLEALPAPGRVRAEVTLSRP